MPRIENQNHSRRDLRREIRRGIIITALREMLRIGRGMFKFQNSNQKEDSRDCRDVVGGNNALVVTGVEGN